MIHGQWLDFTGTSGPFGNSVTRLEATVAIAEPACSPMHEFGAGPAAPAFFRRALTTVAVKNLIPNFPRNPLAHNPI